MKYEGRSSGLKLLTGRSDVENAHILAGHLQGDQMSAASKEVLLFSTCRKIFGGVVGAQSPRDPIWVALRQTGLIETLLKTLVKQDVRESKLLPREEIDWGFSEMLISLSMIVVCEPWRLDREVKDAAKMKLGEALRFISSEYGLRSDSDPKEVYKIQCLTVSAMGLVLSDFGLEYILHDTANAPALVSLALAVVFDPIADLCLMDGIHKDMAHRQVANILITFSAGQLSWCFEDIAPSIANKYGAKRITSTCNSYFANPRYITRGYTGLSLCAAIAAAKSLHPKLITEGKIHLTILQWFWKAFRGPEEVDPDDKMAGDVQLDLSLLPADLLSILWAIIHRVSSDLRTKLLNDLVLKGDLIMALGHWFLAAKTKQTLACEGFTTELARQYAKDQRFVTLYIEPAWKHVFQTLNSAKRSGVPIWKEDVGIDIWRCFGENLGLVAHNHPNESQVKAVPDFLRCESLICPLYGEYAFGKLEPGVLGLKCTRCQLGMSENGLELWATSNGLQGQVVGLTWRETCVSDLAHANYRMAHTPVTRYCYDSLQQQADS
ncbi:hypothetical protein FS837_000615 [Tulasnella sp. UAMH 9824]|nr:hypothetical protein FS837_000615 [Tulasnella sp. UAMH 9824]